MVLALADYRVTGPLHGSGRSRLLCAVSERDGSEVIAKVFDIADETVEARVQHEFELIRGLDVEGIVRAESLQRVGDQLVLILERAPGVDLRVLAAGQPLPLELFGQIAIQIAEILAQTHAQRIIHRDIKPANLLFDAKSGRAHLADFGISVLLESERRHIYDDQILSGTLPYISPEQTGRTNRSVDFRSDLYSLGVTFYELLTGQRPFEDTSPLELIHAHLARTPRAPHELVPELPIGISRLVMKLLAKAPEHRYQTATGLAADLRELLGLHERGQPDASYELGRADRSTSLQLPHQLYGREHEHRELREAFEQLIASKARQTALLAGPPGVGKSALLDELEVAAIGHGGHVLRGKYGAYHELPYAAIVQAFTGMFELLLTETDAGLLRWRRRLVTGLGGLVNVVCELVPALTLIVGEQPKLAELGPIEGRNRLHVAIERLVSTLCEHGPLVLMLDDLHAADHGSIALLETLIRGVTGPLLITGTLRPGQIPAGHPLQALIDEVEAQRLPRAGVINVAPLSSQAIEALLHDALGGASDQLHTLAAIVKRKTGGVPLFIGQFMSQLVTNELLLLDADGWRWDQSKVEAAQIPDDAVEMMSNRLRLLPAPARLLLGRAACLGIRFGLAELALVSDCPPGELVGNSFELIEAGLLVGIGHEYGFTHDSIQHAARRQLPPDETRRVHWKIARHLLETLEGSALDEQLFEIVEHLDAGIPEQLEPAQRVEVATLNLRAGQRALDSAAYDLALRYFGHGLEQLEHAPSNPSLPSDAASGEHDKLVFGLWFGHAQTLALASQHERANAAFDTLLARPLSPYQYGLVISRRIRLLQLDNRQPEAIALGRDALAQLGAPLPRKVGLGRALLSLTRAWLMIRGFNLDTAMALPACEDPRGAALFEIVSQLKYPAFIVDLNLFMYLSGVHVLLLGTHGFHETTPIAMADLSINVGGGFNKPHEAQRTIDLAQQLCARTDKPDVPRSNIVAIAGSLCYHRTRPYADFLHEFELAYLLALELGEFDHAAFIAAFGLDMQLEVGTHLAVLDRRALEIEYELGCRGAKQMQSVSWVAVNCCAELLGERALEVDGQPRGIAQLTPEALLARGGVPTNDYAALADIALVQVVLGDYAAALETGIRAAPKIAVVLFNSWLVPRSYLALCVAVSAQRLAGQALPPNAQSLANKGLSLLRAWAKACPSNYGHYLELALGLREAVRSHAKRARLVRAIAHLDRAWIQARTRGCRWVEGIAAQFVAELLERHGGGVLVEGAWRRAWDAYSAWGAEAKLERLRARKPTLFAEPERRRGSPTTGPATGPSSGSSNTSLDLEGVLRSVGVITEDLHLDEVITRVLDAALTCAGAGHGQLLLERGGELTLVAEARGADHRASVLRKPRRLRDVGDQAPRTIINFVVRTGKSLVLDDAGSDPRFASDPYLARHEVHSLIAMPIVRNALIGVLVLENRLRTHGFTPASIETLRLITDQAASTLDNARLYAALGRSEARWRSLVDGAPDMIALLDERGRFAFVNRSLDAESDFIVAMTPESREKWYAAVELALANGEQRELEVELPGPSTSRWYAVRIAAIALDGELDGEANGELDHELDREGPEAIDGRSGRRRRNAIAVATDITDRKHAEAEREQLAAQVRQQQRLESLGTLASGVAHEINNPMQGIMNYAELIADNPDDRNTVLEFAGEITHETERVSAIVRNLLTFSRQEHEQDFEQVQVRALIDGTLSLINAILRRDQITMKIDVPPLLVRCRSQQIQQIIMNLVTNARDALNEHHPGRHARKHIQIRAHALEGVDRVRISVEDNGGGIPEAIRTKIFDPFFTTKDRDHGTGLGLSVSHGIAHEHDGELSVETHIGKGTCFHLDLPAGSASGDGPSSLPP
ncbi:protein kinase domain-containing protein [Enhygromyxa salina]|nr:AAA family ATPase [Enhygromyxa salina]